MANVDCVEYCLSERDIKAGLPGWDHHSAGLGNGCLTADRRLGLSLETTYKAQSKGSGSKSYFHYFAYNKKPYELSKCGKLCLSAKLGAEISANCSPKGKGGPHSGIMLFNPETGCVAGIVHANNKIRAVYGNAQHLAGVPYGGDDSECGTQQCWPGGLLPFCQKKVKLPTCKYTPYNYSHCSEYRIFKQECCEKLYAIYSLFCLWLSKGNDPTTNGADFISFASGYSETAIKINQKHYSTWKQEYDSHADFTTFCEFARIIHKPTCKKDLCKKAKCTKLAFEDLACFDPCDGCILRNVGLCIDSNKKEITWSVDCETKFTKKFSNFGPCVLVGLGNFCFTKCDDCCGQTARLFTKDLILYRPCPEKGLDPKDCCDPDVSKVVDSGKCEDSCDSSKSSDECFEFSTVTKHKKPVKKYKKDSLSSDSDSSFDSSSSESYSHHRAGAAKKGKKAKGGYRGRSLSHGYGKGFGGPWGYGGYGKGFGGPWGYGGYGKGFGGPWGYGGYGKGFGGPWGYGGYGKGFDCSYDNFGYGGFYAGAAEAGKDEKDVKDEKAGCGRRGNGRWGRRGNGRWGPWGPRRCYDRCDDDDDVYVYVNAGAAAPTAKGGYGPGWGYGGPWGYGGGGGGYGYKDISRSYGNRGYDNYNRGHGVSKEIRYKDAAKRHGASLDEEQLKQRKKHQHSGKHEAVRKELDKDSGKRTDAAKKKASKRGRKKFARKECHIVKGYNEHSDSVEAAVADKHAFDRLRKSVDVFDKQHKHFGNHQFNRYARDASYDKHAAYRHGVRDLSKDAYGYGNHGYGNHGYKDVSKGWGYGGGGGGYGYGGYGKW